MNSPSERASVSRALSRADAAHDKIEAHEELCLERYTNIHARLGEIRTEVKRQGGVQWKAALGVIAFLAAVIVKLLMGT